MHLECGVNLSPHIDEVPWLKLAYAGQIRSRSGVCIPHLIAMVGYLDVVSYSRGYPYQ